MARMTGMPIFSFTPTPEERGWCKSCEKSEQCDKEHCFAVFVPEQLEKFNAAGYRVMIMEAAWFNWLRAGWTAKNVLADQDIELPPFEVLFIPERGGYYFSFGPEAKIVPSEWIYHLVEVLQWAIASESEFKRLNDEKIRDEANRLMEELSNGRGTDTSPGAGASDTEGSGQQDGKGDGGAGAAL